MVGASGRLSLTCRLDLQLLSVIVIMASVCLAIGLWLAIAPTSVYSRWTTSAALPLAPF